MNTSKSVLLLAVLVGLLFVAPTHQAAAWTISIKISFGHGEDCSVRGGICSITIGGSLKTASGTPSGNAGGDLAGNELTVSMSEAIPEGHLVTRGNKHFLVLASDVSAQVAPDAAKQLKRPSLTIEKGEYPVDFSKNKMGTFTLKLKSAMRESPTKSSPSTK
jgi:hypothetical protein